MSKSNKKKTTASEKKPGSRKFLVYTSLGVIVLICIIVGFLLINNDNKSPIRNDRFSSDTPNLEFNKEGELKFISSSGILITQIDVELAVIDEEWAMGLMFRRELAENQGMLFIYPYEDYRSFWMKNTILSLDMLFINSDYEIVTIHKNTVPFTTDTYPPSEPIMYAVEVNAGFVENFNIKLGDKISFESK